MQYLFISNIRSDAEDAKILYDRLEDAGFKLLFDEAADDSPEVSRQCAFTIERSDGFLFVLSPGLTDDSRALQEITIAEDAGKPIQFIRLPSQSLLADFESVTSGRNLIDLSQDFDAGFQRLLTSLEEDNLERQDANTRLDSSEKRLDGISMSPGEELVWSEQGYYWHKKWRNLIRVTTHLSSFRLFFDWDERDIWKWRKHEQEELTRTFPISVELSQISQVGEVQKPKTFLIFSASEPFAEICTNSGVIHKFTLHTHFEQHVEVLQRIVASSESDTRENASQ
jgi:hypothetical protein